MNLNKSEIKKEIEKIIYLYKLKKIIRFGDERKTENDTESVAEHIFGMMILINYFLPLVDPENKMDKTRLYDLALFHDIDEIETGDVITYLKTDKDREEAQNSLKKIFSNTPENILEKLKKNYFEYEDNKSPEAKFIYAIDKIEPAFHSCFDSKTVSKAFKNYNLSLDTIKKDKIKKVKEFQEMKIFIGPLFEIIEENIKTN